MDLVKRPLQNHTKLTGPVSLVPLVDVTLLFRIRIRIRRKKTLMAFSPVLKIGRLSTYLCVCANDVLQLYRGMPVEGIGQERFRNRGALAQMAAEYFFFVRI